MVTISIIVVLVSLLSPAFQTVREQGRRIQCMNNLHQLGLAQHTYAHDNNGWFYIRMTDVNTAWVSIGPINPNYLEGLSNYVKKTEVLYCPTVARQNPKIFSTFPSDQVKPWGQLHTSNTHYGYVACMANWMKADQVLMFEKPNYSVYQNFNVLSNPLGGSLYFELVTGDVFKSDRTFSAGGGMVDTWAGHAEGSNVLFVDGRVAWNKGMLIGPINGGTEGVPNMINPPTPANPKVCAVY